MELTQEDIDRFWSKVDKTTTPDGCWNYTGGVDGHGYGAFQLNKRTEVASRVAYTIENGPIPKGEGYHGTIVMHKCDNRRCCNPDHLFIGTQQDNIDDMYRKGRQRNQDGENSTSVKLTEDQVLKIRSLPQMPHSEIADIYGVSKSNISHILLRKTWKNI